jgi:hypothetical protein
LRGSRFAPWFAGSQVRTATRAADRSRKKNAEAIVQRTEDELQLEGLLLTADYPTRITYGHGGARA